MSDVTDVVNGVQQLSASAGRRRVRCIADAASGRHDLDW